MLIIIYMLRKGAHYASTIGFRMMLPSCMMLFPMYVRTAFLLDSDSKYSEK